MMKRILLATLTVVTAFAGAKLTLAAFGSVLPPGFEAWTDESYDEAYFTVRWLAIEQFEHLAEHGTWARSFEELLPGVSPDNWQGLRIDTPSPDVFTIALGPPEGRFACSITTDRDHARAYVAQPNYRRVRWGTGEDASGVSIHDRMDCRRTTWPWTWLGWTGLDRLRDAPPERYASTDYIDRASTSPR